MKRIFAAAALVLTMPLLSCGTWKAYEKAQQAEKLKEWDEAVSEYDKGLETDPDNMKLRIAQQRAKLEASRSHFEKGKTYEAAALTAKTPTEQLQLAQLAATELELTVKLDSTNQFAAVELGKTVAMLQDLSRAADSATLEAQKRRAKALSGKVAPPQLNPASDQPISLSFPHDTPVKEIYRALGNAFGINIMFDQAVKDDRISIELKDVTAQQALERVMQAANHFYKVLDEHTIIVVPDNPQARRDYEDLVIRTFYLSNGDAEQVTNVVRTMIEARNVFPLKALNAITIRDTADKVRIAEKIIEANDKAKAEVVVDVELLQLDLNKTRNLGMDLTGTSGSVQAVGAPDDKGVRSPLSAVTRQQLAHLGAGDLMFSIPSVEYAFLKQATNSELLANPELRISEGEKATLHIGSRIPVPVSTFTSVATTTSGGTFAPVTSFQYQDIGIKVSIEPRVHHNREVTLKLTVEVSSLGGSAPGTGAGTGTPSQPIFNTRTIESTIRLKDGETNFLAGLIQDSRNDSDNQTPFLGEIPILGRLFTTNLHQQTRTDLILTMTPHIVRIPDITDDDLAPMWVGTANNITFRGVSPRIESQTATDPFTARPDLSSTIGGGRGTGALPLESTPVMPPPPLVTPAPGMLPSSPFNGRPAPVNPNPQPVEPQAQLNAPPKAVATVAGIQVSQGTAPTDPFAATPPQTSSASTLTPVSTAAASSDTAPATPTAAGELASLSPRLSPQPVSVSIKPGAERTWSVVAMDLDGLTAPQIVMHYDPHALEVLDLSFGPAFAINTATPPVVNIDRDSGTIRISSSDTHPLQFAGGGELVTLHVRGGVSGETFLVLDNPDFRNADGKMVMSTISGGRAKVE